MSDAASEAFRFITEHDVPEELVEKVLSRLKRLPDFERFSQADWNKLREQRPNLHHFISVASVEAEPEDPIKRERIAAAMLGMVILENEIDLQKGEERIASLVDEQFSAELGELFISPEPPAPAA